MKKNAFSLCLAGTVLFGTVTTPALALSVDKLTDVSKNDWFYPYVQYVAEKEYMVGVAENTFAPNMQVTRAMFVTTLAALDGAGTSTARTPFTDVADGAWYSNAVKWAYANGIVAGVSATEFAPNAVISREQMCVMMSAFLNYRANKDDVTFKTTVDEKTFPDAASISTWAKDAVKKSQMWGLVAGDENGYMNPQKAATRAEAAVMLKQLDAVLASGVSTGGGSSGGGGGSTETASYTIRAQLQLPADITTDKPELSTQYTVKVNTRTDKVTGDPTFGAVAEALVSDSNEVSNLVSWAIDRVKGETRSYTVKDQKVTVSVAEDHVISATVAVKVTDLNGDTENRATGFSVENVTIDQMEDLVQRLQDSNGSFEVLPGDAEVLDALIQKAEQLGNMSIEEINERKDQYIKDNPKLEQALSGMTAENIQQAAKEYKTQLETELKPVVKEENVGKVVEVKVEATTMNVAIDLEGYLEDADKRHEEEMDRAIQKVEKELYPDGSKTLNETQKGYLTTMYNLYKPSQAVSNDGGVISMKTAAQYTEMLQAYVAAMSDFYDSLGENAVFYQGLLDRAAQKNSEGYGITYTDEDATEFATLLGDTDGILVDENLEFRNSMEISITVDANDTSYGTWLDLIVGRFNQADGLLPTQLPDLLGGSYTLILEIEKN